MGGEVLELASDRIRAEGFAEGYAEGFAEALTEGAIDLAKAIDKLRAGVTFDEVKAQYGEHIANLAKTLV